jgi:DNA helicase HerA-like ATPase
MRLSTDRDQDVMRSNTHDGALDLLNYLPVLGDREAIVLGQGVPMPMRIKFRDLNETAVPRSRKDGFSAAWKSGTVGRAELEEIVALWRATGRFVG